MSDRFTIIQKLGDNSANSSGSAPRFTVLQAIDRTKTAEEFRQKEIEREKQQSFDPKKNFDNLVKGNPIPSVHPTAPLNQQNLKEPGLLDKVLIQSGKEKQSVGQSENVAEIGALLKNNVNPIKNPKNNSQALILGNQYEKEDLKKFESSIASLPDFAQTSNAGNDASVRLSVSDKGTFDNINANSGIYRYMTGDEKSIYYYLIKKNDNATARKYISDKMPELESRKAESVAEDNSKSGFSGNLKNFATAASSGFQSGLTNMARMGVSGNIAAGNSMPKALTSLIDPTYSEKLFSEVRNHSQDKGFIYNILLDTVNSIAAQIPQVAIGVAGGSGAYLAAMANQIIGSDTTEAINNGYEGMRGIIYGAFDTALEFLTEKALGGIASKIDGGETSKLVKTALKAVDDTVSNRRIAGILAKTISIASSMNADGTEEFLQALIEPVARNVIYGEHNRYDSQVFYDAIRTYIIGAISGGIMGIPYIGETLNRTRADILGSELKQNSGVKSLLRFAEVVENNSDTYHEVKSTYDAGRDVDTADLAHLYLESAEMFETVSPEILKNYVSKNIDGLISSVQSGKMHDSYQNPDLQSTAKTGEYTEQKSAFTEPSVQRPEPDPIKDMSAQLAGLERLTDDQREVRKIGNELGWKIEFDTLYVRDDNGKIVMGENHRAVRADGSVDRENKKIVLDYSNDRPVQFIMKHETADYLTLNPAAYADFQNAVMDSNVFMEWVKSKGFSSISEYNSKIVADRINSGDPNFTRDGANPEYEANIEMVSDFCGEKMFGGEKSLEGFLNSLKPQQRKNILQKFIDLIKKIKDKFTGKSKTFEAEISALEQRFAKAYQAAEQVRQQNTTTESGGVRYSLRPGLENDVDKALSDTTYRDDVYLTESSPSIIASQKGVRNLPMLMKASHIRENIFSEQEAKNIGLKVDKHTHYHGLGKDLFLKIINGLDDVRLAYRGTKNASDPSRREKYFLLISQYKDANGNTVNVPVYIDEKGQYNRIFIDTNKIATVFGRDDFSSYIQKEIKNGNLIRIKNKSIQASERTALIAAGYSENTFTDITVSQNDTDVNTSISEKSENDTETGNKRYSISTVDNDAHTVSGWAYNGTDTPVEVHVYVFDQAGNEIQGYPGIMADIYRPDLQLAEIGNGSHGFVFKLDFYAAFGVGTYTVKAYGINGSTNPQLSGEYTVTVEAPPVIVPEPTPEPVPEPSEPEKPVEPPVTEPPKSDPEVPAEKPDQPETDSAVTPADETEKSESKEPENVNDIFSSAEKTDTADLQSTAKSGILALLRQILQMILEWLNK